MKTVQKTATILHWQRRGQVGVWCLVIALMASVSGGQALASSSLLISQVPLVLSISSHPQVLIAIGNSQSMDGDLSGAIMTGSGVLSSALSSLTNSSSPVNYPVPLGFTPPVQAANSSGQAPYTVNQSGTLVDNGASRLNVAKQGVQAILQAYMQNTDFALEDYSTSGTSRYTTWVYYMSPQSGPFTFTNTFATGDVNNPCANYANASSSVRSYCTSMVSLYGATALSKAYMQIGASSDDPSINDVLYASNWLNGLFVIYAGPNPATPYPPNYTLSNYNNGSVNISYNSSLPNLGGFGVGPTNAGYVPYSPQVMYAQRGFGYYVQTITPTTGDMVVNMTTAGTTPTTSSVSAAIAKFTPFLQPETNNAASSEIKSLAYQSPLAGLLSKAKSYLNTVTSSSSACSKKQYVVLVTDGLPTMDLNGLAWPPLGSVTATGYNVTANFNQDGSLQSTNDQALTDTISAITALNTAGIKTYVIGLGAGVAGVNGGSSAPNSAAVNTLTAMAMAGGTQNYYAAGNSSVLVSDLNAILVAIQNGSLSVSGSTSNTPIIGTNSDSYTPSFDSSDTGTHNNGYLDWTGNLIAINTISQLQIWAAQSKLDTLASGTGWETNRLIATWVPSVGSGAAVGAPFEWASINSIQQADLQPADSLGQSRLNYLRGDTSQEQRNGGSFRNRTHILGDIVDSAPLYVGVPNGPYFTTSYFQYQSTEATRAPVVYVGANDGILHAFNATSGAEMFAFVPYAVFANLINLTQPVYNQSHRFFVDGSPNTGDVQFSGGTWHTLLVGGENAGGNSVYALDVTNPQSLTSEAYVANSVLWEFTDSDMGLSYSQPQISAIAQTVNAGTTAPPMRSAVFFGNGYNNPNNDAVLYALNPQTGAVISKINLCAQISGACNASLPEGLSTVTLANSDGVLSAPATTVYAGDLQGNLWAVDISSPTSTHWSVRLLFQAKDPLFGNPQPITTPPAVTLNPNYPRSLGLFVMFGTGQLLTENDLLTTQTQTVYGIWDTGTTNPVTLSQLLAQTLTTTTVMYQGALTPALTDSTYTINWANQVGWYDNLPTAGQRVIVNPQVANTDFQDMLNTPPAACDLPFSSILLQVDYQSGGAAATSQFLGNITAVGGGSAPSNIVGLSVAPGYGSAANLFLVPLNPGAALGGAGTGGAGQVGTGEPASCFTSPCGEYQVINPNTGLPSIVWVPINQLPRSAWWQIQ